MAVATAAGIVKAVRRALEEGWGYVWGYDGTLYTEADAKKHRAAGRSTPQQRDPATYWTEDCRKWFGKVCADCSGLIVWAIRQSTPAYSDRNSATFKNQFAKGGAIASIPEIPGLAVWRSGHIGIYMGNGDVIEARGTDYGVVKTRLAGRNFTHWGCIKDVDYSDPGSENDDEASMNQVIPGRVLYGEVSGNCNLRSLPRATEEAKIHGVLPKGSRVLIREYSESWAIVLGFIDGVNKGGYASTKYLTKVVEGR